MTSGAECGESSAELEKCILRLHKAGTGILKIGKTLGIGTGTVQRVVMDQRALSTSLSLKRRCETATPSGQGCSWARQRK
jgi:hypothetical protein